MSRQPTKAALLMFSVAMLLAGGAAAVRGQSALDGLDPNANGLVRVVVVQPDGKILIGGDFTTLSPNGGVAVTRNRIARLNPDGTLDTAFIPNANGSVLAIVVQANGKILVGGSFNGANSIGGQPRNRIARLEGTTGSADSFNPNATADVNAIAVQADGKILAGGQFFGASSIGGATRNYIARLDGATGSADSFDPNADNIVFALAVQAGGKILAGGSFTTIGGATRNRIARLEGATGSADSFNPNADGRVLAIAVQADGEILAGGDFTMVSPNGGVAVTRNRIARLNPDGTLDTGFNPSASGRVIAIAVQADGKILAGGVFNGANSIGGQPRNLFARLSNDTAALQNLAVAQTAITWTRGGSSPQFTRVTFESSTDNVSYTFLGNGTAAGSNWTLTGLSLPTAQNFYIRARGYYRSGYQNGSESITESVRNVFLTQPPLLNIQRSANTNVVLSWATNFTGFTLEANTNLNTNVWSVVTPAPAVSGTNNVVTNDVSGSTRFYRLRQ